MGELSVTSLFSACACYCVLMYPTLACGLYRTDCEWIPLDIFPNISAKTFFLPFVPYVFITAIFSI